MSCRIPSITDLAQEIIDEIVDQVYVLSHCGWRRNMRLCARICRSFVSRSQKHLFQYIQIPLADEAEDRVARSQEFLKILARSPHITRYIQEIDLYITSKDKTWLYDDSVFLAIMNQITRSPVPLKRFSIQSLPDLEADFFVDSDLPALLNDFFLPSISPFITTLRLENMLKIPIELITSCVNLKELILARVVGIEPITGGTFSSDNAGQGLEVFRCIDSCYALLDVSNSMSDDFSSFIDFSGLRVLEIGIAFDVEDLESEKKVFLAAQKTLQTLIFANNDPFWSSCKPFFSLAGAISLRHLATYCEIRPNDPENLASVCGLLSTITQTNNLESLELTLYLDDIPDGFSPAPDDLLTIQWGRFFSELQRLLTSKKRFCLTLGAQYSLRDEYEAVPTDHQIIQERVKESENFCKSFLQRIVAENFKPDNVDINVHFDYEVWVTLSTPRL